MVERRETAQVSLYGLVGLPARLRRRGLLLVAAERDVGDERTGLLHTLLGVGDVPDGLRTGEREGMGSAHDPHIRDLERSADRGQLRDELLPGGIVALQADVNVLQQGHGTLQRQAAFWAACNADPR